MRRGESEEGEEGREGEEAVFPYLDLFLLMGGREVLISCLDVI